MSGGHRIPRRLGCEVGCGESRNGLGGRPVDHGPSIGPVLKGLLAKTANEIETGLGRITLDLPPECPPVRAGRLCGRQPTEDVPNTRPLSGKARYDIVVM